jgi:hypothetical protein
MDPVAPTSAWNLSLRESTEADETSVEYSMRARGELAPWSAGGVSHQRKENGFRLQELTFSTI